MSGIKVQDVTTGYGKLTAVKDVSFEAQAGEITVVLGHNGAGKTTLLNAMSGALALWSGSVDSPGDDSSTMAMVPQGRGVFPRLTIGENITLGLIAAKAPKSERAARIDDVLTLLPVLKPRWDEKAGNLSGGQRQMVNIGRALVTAAPVLLLDEPSTGLAPKIVQDMMAVFRELSDRGKCVVLVEQNVQQALAAGDRALVMKSGRIIADETCVDLLAQHDLWSLF